MCLSGVGLGFGTIFYCGAEGLGETKDKVNFVDIEQEGI